MDRLGFVKTIETVLAAILIISIYSTIQASINNQIGTIKRNPTTLMNDFIEMINEAGILDEAVSSYNYLLLDRSFQSMFLKSVYYYFEPVYYEKLKLTSEYNLTMPNISFVYDFPLGIDENSVRISNNQYELETNARFNYYVTPVSFSEDINDSYVEINITLKAQNLDNKTLMYFVKNKRSYIELLNWTRVNLGSYNATLVVFVPEAKRNEKTYVYCAQTPSFVNFTYPDLTANKVVGYSYFNTYKSSTGQAIFTPQDTKAGRVDTYYITYTLYTNLDNSYADITRVNNTGISLSPELDYLKEGIPPVYSSQKGEYSIQKIIPKEGGFVKLTVYGGYS